MIHGIEILQGDEGGVAGATGWGETDEGGARERGGAAVGVKEGGAIACEHGGQHVAAITLVVPVPIDKCERRIADETTEDALVEVEVHTVPREEQPGEVDLERFIGSVAALLVGTVAKGTMEIGLDLEATGIGVGEGFHERVCLVVLGDVLFAHTVGGVPDTGLGGLVGIQGEADDLVGGDDGDATIEEIGVLGIGASSRPVDGKLTLGQIGDGNGIRGHEREQWQEQG